MKLSVKQAWRNSERGLSPLKNGRILSELQKREARLSVLEVMMNKLFGSVGASKSSDPFHLVGVVSVLRMIVSLSSLVFLGLGGQKLFPHLTEWAAKLIHFW